MGGSAKQNMRAGVSVDLEKCGEAPTVTSQLESHEKQKHELATEKLLSTHKLSEIFKKTQQSNLWLVHLSMQDHDVKM